MASHRFVIVGAGFSGLGAAIRLKREGIEDFVVLERRKELGGTWYVNRYPGCQCDIPSHLYSFSFAPNPGWTRTYSEREEIWQYLSTLARDLGIEPHISFEHELSAARWDEHAKLWQLDTSAGELEAQVLIVCPGALSEPKLPRIKGLGSFKGTIFHSADWGNGPPVEGRRTAVEGRRTAVEDRRTAVEDRRTAVEGRRTAVEDRHRAVEDRRTAVENTRIGVIGTGASAIQLIPHIQPLAAELLIFQRTPGWVIPHRDRPTRSWERTLYRLCPPAQLAPRLAAYVSRELMVPALMRPRAGSRPERIARRHLCAQVPDPELRATLTPSYRIGCKRILISNDFYPALMAPNTELVTDPIEAITPEGILTADGHERQLDTIILATGFRVAQMRLALRIRGRGGVTLAERWQGGAEAYLGTAVAGFPNMFLLVGPNTGLGHNSIVYMIESQLRYMIGALSRMERIGARTVEVHKEAQGRYSRWLHERLRGTVWAAGGCNSWYLDHHGQVVAIWPGFSSRFRLRASRFRPDEHVFEGAPTNDRVEGERPGDRGQGERPGDRGEGERPGDRGQGERLDDRVAGERPGGRFEGPPPGDRVEAAPAGPLIPRARTRRSRSSA